MRDFKLLIAAALVVALGIVGCDRDEASPRAGGASQAALDKTTTPSQTGGSAAENAEESAVFETHPWPEEYHRLVATVSAEHTVEYREAPDREAKVVGRKTLTAGSRLSFGDSLTQVTEPFVAKATRSVKVSGATDDGERVEQNLTAGESYRAYLYAGEGLCHVEIAGKMAVGDCPDKQHFQAEEWSGQAPVPAAYDLWLKTRKGWMLVDRDAVDLESVSTL